MDIIVHGRLDIRNDHIADAIHTRYIVVAASDIAFIVIMIIIITILNTGTGAGAHAIV